MYLKVKRRVAAHLARHERDVLALVRRVVRSGGADRDWVALTCTHLPILSACLAVCPASLTGEHRLSA